jgi:molybdate transport system regulatory protein
MLLWCVGGSRRGVGKTHLSRALCAILPCSAYAKLGHRLAKKGKSLSYYTSTAELTEYINRLNNPQHVVVESNTYVHTSIPTVSVFIDVPLVSGDIRGDAAELAAKAMLHVSVDSRPGLWRRRLKQVLSDDQLVEAVFSLLQSHQRWLRGGGISVRSKVWLVNAEGDRVLGAGLARVLQNVSHLGSLSAAAQAEGRSYRHIWGWVRQAEASLGLKLLERSSGGSGGGGSALTADAKRVLRLYFRLNERVETAADDEFDRLRTVE